MQRLGDNAAETNKIKIKAYISSSSIMGTNKTLFKIDGLVKTTLHIPFKLTEITNKTAKNNNVTLAVAGNEVKHTSEELDFEINFFFQQRSPIDNA